MVIYMHLWRYNFVIFERAAPVSSI